MILIRKEDRPRRRKIGGVFTFPPSTPDEAIIEHILRDFSLKLLGILKEYYDPAVGCSSLCTYEIFDKRWGIDDPGDVSSEGEKIYQEIPSDRCTRYVMDLPGGNQYTRETIRRSFDRGEFPSITIWKGYHKGRDEIHVTYSIGR